MFTDQQEYPFPIVQPQPHTQQYMDSISTMDASGMTSQYNTPAEVQPHETKWQYDQQSQQQTIDEHIESAEVERKNSTSTVGTSIEVGSPTDSAHYSTFNTSPESIKHGSPISRLSERSRSLRCSQIQDIQDV